MKKLSELSVLLRKACLIFFYMNLCKITVSGRGGGAGDWKAEEGEPLS